MGLSQLKPLLTPRMHENYQRSPRSHEAGFRTQFKKARLRSTNQRSKKPLHVNIIHIPSLQGYEAN